MQRPGSFAPARHAPTTPTNDVTKALDLLHGFLKVVITILMAVLIVPVTMQILSRYTGIIPRYIWTEEIARFCFVWIVMIGSMIAVRDGTHFDVDVLPHLKSAKLEAASKIFVHIAMLATGLIFLIFGWDFIILGARQLSEIAQLPMVTIYCAWPLAGLIWIMFLIEKLKEDLEIWRGERKPDFHHEQGSSL